MSFGVKLDDRLKKAQSLEDVGEPVKNYLAIFFRQGATPPRTPF